MIVLDDGSTDGSIDVIRKFAEEVRIERQVNRGQNNARNRLTELSRGEWLVYLDADDELAPDSVEKKIALADGADAIYGTIEVASFAGNEKTRTTIYPAPEVEDPIAAAFNWSLPNTSAFLFRKMGIIEAGGWNEEIKNCTDYDMYFRLLLKGKRFRAAPAARSLYRQWSSAQAVYQDPLRKMRARLQLMWWVVKQLAAAARLTTGQKEAFEQAAFGVVRMIAQFNREEASQQYTQLLQWNPKFVPKTASPSFRMAWKLGGFDFAECLASAVRRLNPTKRSLPGVDPRSGLPYV